MDKMLGQVFNLDRYKLNVGIIARFIPFSIGFVVFFAAWYLYGFFNLNFPIAYNGGDSMFMLWLIKRMVDGAWYFKSTYSGFPFGSVFLDFPFSDSGNFAICKLLGSLTHNVILTHNLFFLLGFSVTSSVSYVVLQKLGMSSIFSLVGAIVFAFLPFHLLRLPHLFYTWYFNIPVYIWYAFRIFSNNLLFFEPENEKWKKIQPALILFVLSCFGVYFAFFSVLILIASGIAGSLKWKSSKNLISAVLAISIVTAGVSINVAPNLVYAYKHGRNHELVRQSSESELYGLKLVEMLLPPSFHRFKFFSSLSAKYQSFPLVNENITSSLGLLGSIGLIILLGVALLTPFCNFPIDSRLQLLAFLTICLYFFATIGGFASIFAMLVTPLIRAWNRVSVFIAFTSITAFLLVTEKILKKIINLNFLAPVSACLGFFLIGFGILDQTVFANSEYLNQLKRQFFIDQRFVQKIEQLIPGGAVYQLPYMPFPEGAFMNNNHLLSYDLLRGYLHSSSLHWSFGGMKGRSGDLFFRELAMKPLLQQVNMVKKLNFKGIYIDRKGYSDHGVAIEKELVGIIGDKEKLINEDNNLSFFML